MEKVLLSGNEAIARGAYEAGVTVAYGYPGTPSTEILEELSGYEDVYAEWAPNEKVAFEAGIGSSIAGARTLVTMKQVGLNVAADPLFTFAYTGVNGGFVFVNADDPQLHSSQNEQDNRHYARAAKVPMLEPSDSQEAKDLMHEAYRLSEEFDTPVMLRTTTRIAHSKSIVTLGMRRAAANKPYIKSPQKYVMLPGHAVRRHAFVEERMSRLAEFAESFPYNRIEPGSRELGIIAGGVAYRYAKEMFPGASYLKLTMTWPLPTRLIGRFAGQVERLIVLEELDPFLETEIKAMGVAVEGKRFTPLVGEMNPGIVYASVIAAFPEAVALARPGAGESLAKRADVRKAFAGLPMRPPALCPGCPHTAIFFVLRKLNLIVNGDIGCYTLGALPPLAVLDTQLCMGTGASVVHGFAKADPALAKKSVGVIGDSTFIHSGITPLIDIVYNKGLSTVIILDNRITAMTGRQDHPGTGRTLKGEATKALDFGKLAKAVGVESVRVIDPYDLKKAERVVKEEIAKDEPSLIVSRRACLLVKSVWELPYEVIDAACRECGQCTLLGCPAISNPAPSSAEGPATGQAAGRGSGVPAIDQALCVGCGVCYGVCKFQAIKQRTQR